MTLSSEKRLSASLVRALLLAGATVLLAACSSDLQEVPAQLEAQGSSVTLKGQRGTTVFRYRSGLNINAKGATVRRTSGSAAMVFNKVRSTTLNGGRYETGHGASVSWAKAHGTQAIIAVGTQGLTIKNAKVGITGDGFTFKHGNDNFKVLDSYVKFARDDAFENDRYSNGLVQGNLVDHAFSGFSCREEKNRGAGRKGYTFNIKNNLVAFSSPTRYVFKVNYNKKSHCRLQVSGNIFLIKSDGIKKSINPTDHPRVVGNPLSCPSKNTIVYAGKNKSYLNYLRKANPKCYTVTTDMGVWKNARAQWLKRHAWAQ